MIYIKKLITFIVFITAIKFQTVSAAVINLNADGIPKELTPAKITGTFGNWILIHLGQRLDCTPLVGGISGKLHDRINAVFC